MPFELVKLGDVVRFVGGGTPSKQEASFWNGSIPWVSPKDMKSFYIRGSVDTITEAGLRDSACNLIPTGSVLTVVRSGVLIHTLPVSLTTMPCALNQDMKAMIPTSTLRSPFLAYWLLSRERHILTTCVKKGATVQSISMENLRSLEIPLPPLPEQDRIVEILDQADTLRQQRRQADALSQRILPALFHEMFGELNYESKSLELLTTKIGSGATPRGGSLVYTDVGSLLIRSQNVHKLSIDLSDAVRISNDAFQALQRVLVQRGDVLLNITGASIGRVAPVVTDIEPAVVNQHVCIIRPDFDQLNSLYLAFLLSTPRFQDFIVSTSSGAAQAGFSHEKTKALEIPLPPPELQEAFAERYQRMLNTSGHQTTAAATLETLFQTLLHCAFDGSLTAKWREGHAKELLQEMAHQVS